MKTSKFNNIISTPSIIKKKTKKLYSLMTRANRVRIIIFNYIRTRMNVFKSREQIGFVCSARVQHKYIS